MEMMAALLPAGIRLHAAAFSENKGEDRHDQEDEEQYFSNAYRRGYDAEKSENSCNQRNNQKHDSPT